MPFQKHIYRLIRKYRNKVLLKYIPKDSKTILDIGSSDSDLHKKLKSLGYEVTPADIEPKSDKIKKENIEDMSFKNKSFDTVICLEVLEHTTNPVIAINELKRVAKKQIIISVPYEPFFTLFRFLIWEKEHLWAVTPSVLKRLLGKPQLEKKIFFKRYYFASWAL